MKITFIYPAVGKKENSRYIKSWKMQPLPFMTLAALTPEEHEITLIDDRIDTINYNVDTDLVAINVEAYSALRAYSIAEKFRDRNIPVVFGGYHPTIMTKEASKYADAILAGEAEQCWPLLLDDLSKNKMKSVYKQKSKIPFGLVVPQSDILTIKNYTPLTLIETSRGCPHTCDFCSINAYFKGSYHSRSIESVVDEIAKRKAKFIFFVDDNIVGDIKRAKKLFKALIPLKIRWSSQLSIDAATDKELLSLMQKSGCIGVLIGFESLDLQNLSQMGKAWNSLTAYDRAVEMLRDHGMGIYATFVFGYDNDTKETIKRTLDFAMSSNFTFAAFNHIQPFPGTKLYKRLEKENRMLYDKWWLDPDYKYGKIVFMPKSISPEELELECAEARRKFYSLKSIIKRGFDFKTNMSSPLMSALFFSQNLLAQKEVNGKLGLPLGANLDKGKK